MTEGGDARGHGHGDVRLERLPLSEGSSPELWFQLDRGDMPTLLPYVTIPGPRNSRGRFRTILSNSPGAAIR